MIFLLKKCLKLRDIFINSYFIYFGYNTAYITDYEELLLSLDQTVTQLITILESEDEEQEQNKLRSWWTVEYS